MATHIFDGKQLSREFLESVLEVAKVSDKPQVVEYKNNKSIILRPTDTFEEAVKKHLEVLSIITVSASSSYNVRPNVEPIRPSMRPTNN